MQSESPLPDSNRRPLPYHEGPELTLDLGISCIEPESGRAGEGVDLRERGAASTHPVPTVEAEPGPRKSMPKMSKIAAAWRDLTECSGARSRAGKDDALRGLLRAHAMVGNALAKTLENPVQGGRMTDTLWYCRSCGMVRASDQAPWCRHYALDLPAQHMVPIPPTHPAAGEPVENWREELDVGRRQAACPPGR